MNIPIEAIIELDHLNMAAHFDAIGQKYDPTIRRAGIKREIEEGAQFIFVNCGDRLIAYLEFVMDDQGVVRIPSIQIDPRHGHPTVLRRLLVEAVPKLSNIKSQRIQSSVHPSNHKSLRLHQRLGFRITSSDKDRIRFETPGDELLRRIQKALRRETT